MIKVTAPFKDERGLRGYVDVLEREGIAAPDIEYRALEYPVAVAHNGKELRIVEHYPANRMAFASRLMREWRDDDVVFVERNINLFFAV